MHEAEHERDQLEQIEVDRLKLLATITNEILGARRLSIANDARARRFALGDAEATRVRARVWQGGR